MWPGLAARISACVMSPKVTADCGTPAAAAGAATAISNATLMRSRRRREGDTYSPLGKRRTGDALRGPIWRHAVGKRRPCRFGVRLKSLAHLAHKGTQAIEALALQALGGEDCL